MPTPIARSTPSNVPTNRGAALSGAAGGVQLSYTVPAGRIARLLAVVIQLTNLAPTLAVQIVSGGTTFNLQALATSRTFEALQWLTAGEVVQVNVTAAVALSTFDAAITVEEYEVQ